MRSEYFGEKVLRAVIPRNVRLAEAPSFGKPVLLYDVQSIGSKSYLAAAQEMMKRLDAVMRGRPLVSETKRLGRGLEALLGPVSREQAVASGSLRELPVAAIRPNPFQPRREFDPDGARGAGRVDRSIGTAAARDRAHQRHRVRAGRR